MCACSSNVGAKRRANSEGIPVRKNDDSRRGGVAPKTVEPKGHDDSGADKDNASTSKSLYDAAVRNSGKGGDKALQER